MSRKVLTSLILMLIIAMLTSSLALAADPSASASTRPGSRIGVVSTIGKSQFTLKNTAGAAKKILVSPATRFVKINGDEKTFKNLAAGQWVIAFGTLNENKELEARVVVWGTRFNKGVWSGTRTYGSLISVDEKANTLRVYTQNGLMNFSVDSSTHYYGRVMSLHSLKAGMTAFLSYAPASGSAPVVKGLIAIP